MMSTSDAAILVMSTLSSSAVWALAVALLTCALVAGSKQHLVVASRSVCLEVLVSSTLLLAPFLLTF